MQEAFFVNINMYTVWKSITDFMWNQFWYISNVPTYIENNFLQTQVFISAILSNYLFYQNWHTFLENLPFPKFTSLKIWVVEKSLNFHTVFCEEES